MSVTSRERLIDGYDLVVFDLDGVIYLIDQPIPGAVDAVKQLHREGLPLAYATNNASRRAAEVATLLTGMGVPADPAEVLTSAAAAAEVLRERLPADSPVLVVGAEALRAEVRAAGLRPVSLAEDDPTAVVQGYGPQVGWAELAEASVAVRGGALWVATNTDRTLPSARGPLPGNGSLVAALSTALERDPDLVVGKPQPALFDTAAQRVGSRRPLVVGDRLDTDIAGAVQAGMDSLLVLTGVSRVADLLAAPVSLRPTYAARDLAGLCDPAAVVRLPTGGKTASATGGGWSVIQDDGRLRLVGEGSPLDALAVLCSSAWESASGFAGTVSAGSQAAAEALRLLDAPV